jgi:hypothetical protein
MTSDSVDALKKHFKINKFNRTMYFVDGLTAKVVGVAS